MQLLIKNARIRHKKEWMDIAVEGGKIMDIRPGIVSEAEEVIDAEGHLVTSSFIEPHIHLYKVNVLDELPDAKVVTLEDAIEVQAIAKKNYSEERILKRGGDVVRREIANGTLHIRSHIDLDDVAGIVTYDGVAALKEAYKDTVDIQIVAFPQVGLMKCPVAKELMAEAMRRGADVVGGMPANENTPDDSRAHVKFCFDLAEKYDADIDMHVDETDDPFYRTLEMVADEAIARGYIGRVTAGHTCALAAYDDHYAAYVIEKVAKAGMRIITNPPTNLMLEGRMDKQPIRRGITRVKELLDAGVTVCFGQDNLNDTFYPFGAANSLQLANLTAHAAQMTAPDEIEKLYDMITTEAAKILGLGDYGLEVGKTADMVILSAQDIREAIRLDSDRLYVIHKGKVVAKTKREVSLMI